MSSRHDHPDLSRIIDRTDHVLIDFDGPICSIFAGLSAQSVAAELRGFLLAQGLSVPAHITDAHDPLEVLRFTSNLDSDLTERVDSALRAAEVVAAQRARPTPHARETILACRRTHRTVAVVSNNSTPAVEAYLTAHALIGSVDLVGEVGRWRGDVSSRLDLDQAIW